MSETMTWWRRAALVVGALLMVGVVGTMYLTRTRRQLVVKPYALMLVPRDQEAPFLRDSAYVVRLGGGERGAYPIRITAWHEENGVMLSERQIRQVIEGVVAARRAARLQPVVGAVAAAGGARVVTIALEFWAEGGFDATVRLECALGDRGRGRMGPVLVQLPVMASRGLVTEEEGLTAMLTRLLEAAAAARCPETRARQATEAPTVVAERGAMATAVVPELVAPALATPALSSARIPVVPATGVEMPVTRSVAAGRIAPVSAAERARRDSVALARVGAANARVVRLTISVDSVHLRVGEEVHPERVLHLTGVTADGEEVMRVIPLYAVDNKKIAAFGAGGLRGISPGVTRVVVRAMGGNLATLRSTGASVSFIVKVAP